MRFSYILTTALLALSPLVASAQPAEVGPLTLWYDKPAEKWVEALPLGNGRLGAMLYGGVSQEVLKLNDDTFWSGGPYDPNPADATKHMEEARRLVFAGEYRRADRYIDRNLMGTPKSEASYQPIGDLILDFDSHDNPSSYHRSLSLDTGLAVVEYEVGGVRFKRETFVSPVHQVLVTRVTASEPGSVSFATRLSSQQRARGSIEGEDTVVFQGRGPAGNRASQQRVGFDFRARVLPSGGSMSVGEDGEIVVSKADSAVVLVAIGTSFKRYDDVSGDPSADPKRRLAAASEIPFDSLYAAHLKEHQRLFNRCSLHIGPSDATTPSPAASLPTDRRLRDFASGGEDPSLAPLYFQFGRYLLICSSRPGTQPANLQGIWNESTSPPWSSNYTININTEMNYWAADVTNLGELMEPLLSMVRDMSESGVRSAKGFYGAPGWVAYHNVDLWRGTAPFDGPGSGFWPTGGAWLTVELWNHYKFSNDREFLVELYPILKGSAEFFAATLVEDPNSDWLVTCPSNSPENGHPFGTPICAGPSMDMSILRDLFAAFAEASATLDQDQKLRETVVALRERLAPLQIGAQGQLQEWLEDWDARAGDQRHRHVSHLYALYPSSQITLRGTPELARAAAVSLDTRGDISTGWAIAWRLNLWARLQDGDRAYRILKALLDPSRTYPNLFDAHPPFQIDGNFGGTAGIAELLLQSNAGPIELLPALPSAWPDGQVRGLCARGNIQVDMVWSEGSLDSATLNCDRQTEAVVRYGEETRQVSLAPGEPMVLTDW